MFSAAMVSRHDVLGNPKPVLPLSGQLKKRLSGCCTSGRMASVLTTANFIDSMTPSTRRLWT